MAEKTDGGWAWFVALAVFINVMFIDGTFVTFGIVYPHLLSAFGSSPTITSLTGSLMPAFLLFSSPLAGCLIRRFDCRRVNFVGTCLASFSVLISSTCGHIGTFAVTYGALAGIGIGMISFSGHIMINTYFNKYRGLANGIVASGAGVGVFTMSTLLQQLLDHYSWRGTLLIYSACMLHVCISACLMRPRVGVPAHRRLLDDDRRGSSSLSDGDYMPNSCPYRRQIHEGNANNVGATQQLIRYISYGRAFRLAWFRTHQPL